MFDQPAIDLILKVLKTCKPCGMSIMSLHWKNSLIHYQIDEIIVKNRLLQWW